MSNGHATKPETAKPESNRTDARGETPPRPIRDRRQSGGALLGLAFDGNTMQAVAVRRTNGSVEIRKTVSASLSLNLLTDDPVLVGREIQKHLAAAEIKERACAVGLPLNWVLTLGTRLPDLPEADLAGYLQLEAERGFPYPPEALMLADSRYRTPSGEAYALQVAVPRENVTRLEAVLKAAQLRPVSFSLGIAELHRADTQSPGGVVALIPGERSVGMQISFGGGVAVLRAIEGASELEGSGDSQFHTEQVARELRITLGQLPLDVRDGVRRVRIFGRDDASDELAEQLRPRLEPLGVLVEQVKASTDGVNGVTVPSATDVSPALSLAVSWLAGREPAFEFLPPKVSSWQRLAAKYSSRKLVAGGIVGGALAGLVLLAFAVQQAQLVYWRSKWNGMRTQVTNLEQIQTRITQFRPWFDNSCRSLTILKRISEVFPEDGTVSAKTIEIREPVTVNVRGTARNNPALLRVLDQLRGASGVRNVQLVSMRGQSPLQFTFNFQWGGVQQP